MLDVVGMVPVFGEAADLLNAGIYAVRGDYVNAGLSLVATLPVVGNAATVSKWGLKASKRIIASGQEHHLLSKKIVGAIEKHPLLKGVFSREDRRLIYKLLDASAHKGYQTWHRQYDKMVVDFIQANPKLTPSQSKAYYTICINNLGYNKEFLM